MGNVVFPRWIREPISLMHTQPSVSIQLFQDLSSLVCARGDGNSSILLTCKTQTTVLGGLVLLQSSYLGVSELGDKFCRPLVPWQLILGIPHP